VQAYHYVASQAGRSSGHLLPRNVERFTLLGSLPRKTDSQQITLSANSFSAARYPTTGLVMLTRLQRDYSNTAHSVYKTVAGGDVT